MTSLRMASNGGKTKEENYKITVGYLWVHVQFVGLNTPDPSRDLLQCRRNSYRRQKLEINWLAYPEKRNIRIEITMRRTMSSSDMINP